MKKISILAMGVGSALLTSCGTTGLNALGTLGQVMNGQQTATTGTNNGQQGGNILTDILGAATNGQTIGNVLGSNVLNILLILGAAGLICPMQVQGITLVDFAMMTGSVLLLWLFSYTKLTVARWEGAVLTVLFLGYMTWLVAGAV